MKFLPFLILLISTVCFADIEATILSVEKTAKGGILVTTEFKDTETGALIGTVDKREWSPILFYGKTKAEIGAIISTNIQKKLQGNIVFSFQKETGLFPQESLSLDIVDGVFSNLPVLVGQKSSLGEVVAKFDIDNDGLCEKQVAIDEDGNITKSNITPTAC